MTDEQKSPPLRIEPRPPFKAPGGAGDPCDIDDHAWRHTGVWSGVHVEHCRECPAARLTLADGLVPFVREYHWQRPLLIEAAGGQRAFAGYPPNEGDPKRGDSPRRAWKRPRAVRSPYVGLRLRRMIEAFWDLAPRPGEVMTIRRPPA